MSKLRRLLPATCMLLMASSTAWPQATEPVTGFDQVVGVAKKRGTVRVIARLSNPQPEQALSAAAIAARVDNIETAMRAMGVADVAAVGSQPLIVLEANPAQLDALRRSGWIDAVQEDVPVPPNLAESTVLIGTLGAAALGATGSGWAVAVLDTGVQTSHPFLAGRIAAEACFSTNSLEAQSLCPNGLDSQVGAGAGVNCPSFVAGCIHGTHVAGIAAG